MEKRDEIFKSEKLGKILSPAQKVIIFGTLITAILVFVYSLVFMTPFSDIYQIDGGFLYQQMAQLGITKEVIATYKLSSEAFYVSPFTGKEIGLNLAYFTSFTRNELQVFNHWLFVFGFFGLLASLIPFIYFSQKRKIYYKTNLIVIPAVAGFNLYIGIHMLIQLIANHTSVLSKVDDYYLLSAYQTYINDSSAEAVHEYFRVTDSNPMFIIGYIIAAALILFAISSCLLTFFKYMHQKNQEQVDLSKVVIHE
ncbi:MAG: hypothetical protein MJ214_02270 [Bacilli bacterium]|nr:hypothetical protein [Bacilli bacterium]